MPFVIARAPDAVLPALAQGLSDLAGGLGLAAAGTGELRLKQPLPIYVVAWSQLGPGFLARARLSGWRSLVEAGPALADAVDDRRREVSFGALTRGEVVVRFLAALRAAAALDSFGSPELRVIEVPSLHMAALWLTGAPGFFVPFTDPERSREGGVDPDWPARVEAAGRSRDGGAQPLGGDR